MLNPALGPEWKPDAAKFYMQSGPNDEITVLVDQGSPNAWREPRFYNWIKTLAARAFERGGMLCVHVGRRVTIVLANRDIDVGVVPDDHEVRLVATPSRGQGDYDVVVQARAR